MHQTRLVLKWDKTDEISVNPTLLKCFTMNEYTLKYSFEFAKEITNQNSNCFMASLDVDSLFTNVPLDETIKICIDELFKSDTTVSRLNKMEIIEML